MIEWFYEFEEFGRVTSSLTNYTDFGIYITFFH